MILINIPPPEPVISIIASIRPVSALISLEGMATPMPKAQKIYMAAMTMPPVIMALGICLWGFSISPAKVHSTSKPRKLNMITDI